MTSKSSGKNPLLTPNNKQPKNIPKKGSKNGNHGRNGHFGEGPSKPYGHPPDFANIDKPIQLMKRPPDANKIPQPLMTIVQSYTADTFPMKVGNCQLQGGYELRLHYVDNIDNPTAIMATLKRDNRHDDRLSCIMFRDTPEATVRENVKALMMDMKCKKDTNREPVNLGSLPWLKRHHIYPLREKVDSFPEAVYYCDLCDYHISTIPHARSHLDPNSDHRHSDIQERIRRREYLSRKLSGLAGPSQLEAINSAIKNIPPLEIVGEQGTTTFHQFWANEVKTKLLAFLAEDSVFKDRKVVLELFGSALVGCEFADSDINLYLDVEGVDDSDTTELMMQFKEAVLAYRASQHLKGEVYYHDGPFPRISMSISEKNVRVVFAWKNKDAFKFSRLLALYVKWQPKLSEFLRIIRYWAKKCNMFGSPGLNKHGYDIMAIHFLQHIKKKLTILNEDFKVFDLENDDLTDSKVYEEKERQVPTSVEKDFNLASLLVEFFCYYSRERETLVQMTTHAQRTRKETKWNNKIFQIENPIREDNVVNFAKAFQPYFWNCILQTFVYFAVPRNKDGPVTAVNLFLKEIRKKKREKQAAAVVEEDWAPQTPQNKKLTEHEARWKAEGLKEGEDPAEFIQCKAEKALTESAKKRRRNRGRRQSSVREDESEMEEEVTRGPEDFPKLMVDGILVENLKPDDVEIDDELSLQRSRRAMLRIRRRFELPDGKLEEMVYELNRFPNVCRDEPSLLPPVAEEEPPTADGANEEQATNTVVESNEGVDNTPLIRRALEIMKSTRTPQAQRQQAQQQAQGEIEVIELADGLATLSVCNEVDRGHELPVEVPEDVVLPPIPQLPAEQSPEETREKIASDEFFADIDETTLGAAKQACSWVAEDFDYTFEEAENFTLGYLPFMKCTYCDSLKHLSEACPEMQIPEVEEISHETTEEEWEDLNAIIANYYHKHQIHEDRREYIVKYVKELEAYLRMTLKGGRLDIFGSLENGFGSEKSDADICFRFEADQPPEDIDGKEVITKIDKLLRERRTGGYIETSLVLSAKVPVVKFRVFRDKGRKDVDFEGDISYYNDLALYNTQLLAKYCEWEPQRLPLLGAWIKYWAKQLDIGDASKGSLSSYSYTIMTIYYLQHCDPPVLPNLQEDFRSDDTLKEIRSDWDVYFHRKVEDNWSKNTKSVAELFVGFLDFVSRLDLNNLVIQIRRRKPMPKLEKKWNRSLSIEDPFDLNHNLGSGLSQRMFVHILKSFIQSRAVFMKPDVRNRIKKPKYVGDEESPADRRYQFLDILKEALLNACNAGKAPTDRLCHLCHRVGHFFENCPKKAERNGDNRKFDNRRRGGGGGDFRRRDGRDFARKGGQPQQQRNGYGNGRQQYKQQPNGQRGGQHERQNVQLLEIKQAPSMMCPSQKNPPPSVPPPEAYHHQHEDVC